MNGKYYEVEVSPEVSLSWVMREPLRFKGTKCGCGIGLFGACTVHLDGKAKTAC
jgi:isoquinoline 1-oxidoreductase alpha subunit